MGKSCDTCEFNFGSVCAGHGVRSDNGEDTYGMTMKEAKKMFQDGCKDWGISLEAFVKEQNQKKQARKKKLYYNPIELPTRIKFVKGDQIIEISEEDCFRSTEIENPPVYLDQLFAAVKQYDNIIIELTSHNEAYFWKKEKGEDVRVPVRGEINLSEFSNGGGYLRDRKLILSVK